MSTLVVSAVQDSSANSLLPLPGTVMFFAASTAPSGWIKCNGASLSTTIYAALFAATGYTFGGSGASFNVPDLRGEFIRGWDDARGIDTGRAFGVEQADAIRNITGTISLRQDGFTNPTGAFTGSGLKTSFDGGQGYNARGTAFFDASTVVPTSTENRPRNIALLACIKF
jgi:phage-related tail fiber protein